MSMHSVFHHRKPPVSGDTKEYFLDKSGYNSSYFAAYSFRKLRSAYSGNCCRVRRTSDSVEVDIGFASSGWVDKASILSHCGSSDGFVVTWYDQSGNNYHMTTSASTQQGQIYSNSGGDYYRSVNNFPSLSRETGSLMRYVTSSNVLTETATQISVGIITQGFVTTSDTLRFAGYADTSTINIDYVLFYDSSQTTGVLYRKNNGTASSLITETLNAFTASTLRSTFYRGNSSNSYASRQDQTERSSTTLITPASLTVTTGAGLELLIGRGSTATHSVYSSTGYGVSEVIFWTTALTSSAGSDYYTNARRSEWYTTSNWDS